MRMSIPSNQTWTSGTVTSEAESRTDAQTRYRQSAKGKTTSKRHTRKQTQNAYLNRPFIAWDGEGVTMPLGNHLYTSLQSSSGVSLHDISGLRSFDIFDAICNEGHHRNPDAIHVIYGGGYDFNMWLSDVPYDVVEELYRTGRAHFGQYVLAWRPSKHFKITRRKDRVTVLVNDVVSFFQRPFVDACIEYLGDRFIERDLIIDMKKRRGTFTHEDQETVDRYNTAELENLVLLMEELRLRLNKVGLRPSRWDGPGAIAVALMQREGVKNGMGDVPARVSKGARFAYAGGRFEVFKHGLHDTVYEYDINSAYPTALQYVPNLQRGNWRKSKQPLSVYDFAIYRVRYVVDPDNFKRPQPLWVRSPKGSIFYGYNLENWYWAPEVIAAKEYVRKHGGSLEIVEGYKFHPAKTAPKPFAFIPPMYEERQKLKAAKDGAHVGIKLGLNSLYGKTCQRVGARFDERTGEWRIPPYHQLEWAGYVTSFCRAHLLLAVLDRLDDVIAMETDAMFIRGNPLDGIVEGKNLGEWESTIFDGLAYGQSGFYTGVKVENDGTRELIVRTRGIDRPVDDDERESFAVSLRSAISGGDVLPAQMSRFVGVGLALQLNKWERWRRWETTDKNVTMEPNGKRVHEPASCSSCEQGNVNHHETLVPMPFWNQAESSPYPIPWINPNPDMTELDELSKFGLEMMGHDYE